MVSALSVLRCGGGGGRAAAAGGRGVEEGLGTDFSTLVTEGICVT